MTTKNDTYMITFDTNKFSQRQLKILHKLGNGFLSPLHDQCIDRYGKNEPPHYRAVIQLPGNMTNQEVKQLLKDNIRYPISSVRSSLNLQTGTKAICHKHNCSGKESYYDKYKLQWFGYKKDEPDYRLWFYYQIYTKTGLKNYRGWTNKCLRYLPAPTDEKKNPYYSSQISDAWNEYLIEDLEKKEPIKSILAKKNDPNYQKKKERAAQKAKTTKRQNIINGGLKYAKELKQQLTEKTNNLSPEIQTLAKILQNLTVLNHLAKTLQSNNFEYTPTSHSWIMEKLSEMYSTDKIYDIKNQVERVIMNKYPELVKIQAYIPEDCDNIWVDFCPNHYEYFKLSDCSPLDFFWSDPDDILQCPHCHVSIQDLYYACYNFQIELSPDLKFDYHCPYPVGKLYFGPIKKLPKISQMPNENSPFQFGHIASENEEEYAITTNLLTPIENWLTNYDQSKFTIYPNVVEDGNLRKQIDKIHQHKLEQKRLKQEKTRQRQQADKQAQQYIQDHTDIWNYLLTYLQQNETISKNIKKAKFKNLINKHFDHFIHDYFPDAAQDAELTRALKRKLGTKKPAFRNLLQKAHQR